MLPLRDWCIKHRNSAAILRLLHQSLIGRCCIYAWYSIPSLEGVVSTFASPSHSLKVLHLRLLHQSLIGRCCIYAWYAIPSLEGVVSTLASPSHSLKVVSAFATPVSYCKVLYLRLLHHSLFGRCCICVCYTTPSLEGAVSVFATPVPHRKV